MAKRNILTVDTDNETLRKKSREVEVIDERIITLLEDMAETMYDANGVGLAAPQVGILKRVVVIDVGDGLIELINPVITYKKGVSESSRLFNVQLTIDNGQLWMQRIGSAPIAPTDECELLVLAASLPSASLSKTSF